LSVYYLNLTVKYEDGIEHYEVHRENCGWFDDIKRAEKLGNFPDCHGAIREAKRRHPSWRIDGCKHCSPECHNL